MTEILYIQAGSQANYIGTHFWNTQETYLAFDDPEDPYIQHDVSFTEVMKGSMGSPTYCPRAILFDRKSNFGSLTRSNAFGNEDLDIAGSDILWSGHVHEYRQEAISKSKYHAKLEETDELRVTDMDVEGAHLHQGGHEIRYWSDFSRVYYRPKSIQPLPDPMYGEIVRGDWRGGHELFHRSNEDTSIMDESVRPFLEECDFFQGLHILNDVETFGGFTDAFLTTFHDDFSKASSLVIPILSSIEYGSYDAQVAMSVFNEALYLRSLRELSSMVLPIQNPSTWPSYSWSNLSNLDKQKNYQTSAFISTHLETSTLPVRQNRSRLDLSSFCTQARRYGVDVVCGISGYAPVMPSIAFDRQLFSFSDRASLTNTQQWSCMDVIRGFSPLVLSKYEQWRSEYMQKGVSVSTINAPAHPLPSSYPAIFRESDFVDPPYKGKDAPPAVSVISSIYTGSGTAKMFSTYAQFLQTAQRSGFSCSSVGLETDEVRELIDDLWALHDGYSVAYGDDLDGEVE